MGLDPVTLPDAFKRCMVDRPKNAPILRTADEAAAKGAARNERKMHELFQRWLCLQGLWATTIHARMDRKSTIRAGWPDFSIFANGSAVFIEMKDPGGVVDREQGECLRDLVAAGHAAALCFTVEDAIRFTKESLKV